MVSKTSVTVYDSSAWASGVVVSVAAAVELCCLCCVVCDKLTE